MVKILGAFTALFLLIAAFVAFKNNTRLKGEIADKKEALDILKENKDELAIIQGKVNELPGIIAAIDEKVALALQEEETLKSENAALKADIDTKNAKIASNVALIEQSAIFSEKGGDVREISAELKELSIKIEELALVEKSTEDQLTSKIEKKSSIKKRLDALRENSEKMNRATSLPHLKTRIASIYPNWGFVTLASGFKAGVIGSSPLDVVRDGKVIAKLLVTTVESNSASASVIPDSIADDVTLMIGDKVVPGAEDIKASSLN